MAKKKDTIEVTTYSPDLVNNLKSLEFYKQDIDTQANNCLQIKVVDDSTLSICQQNLSKINQLVKIVDDKRAEIKAPYFEAGKLIDKTAKEMVELAVKAVEHLKAEVKAWELKKQQDAYEASQKLLKEQAEAQEKLAAEEKRKSDIMDYINNKALPTLKSMYASCTSVENCDQALVALTMYKPREFFQEFADIAYEYKDNYTELINAKKVQLESADTMSEGEKRLAEQREELAKQEMELAGKRAEIKAAEDAIAAEKSAKVEAERVRLEQEKIQAQLEMDKTKGIRRTWKVELVDKSKLITDWICMDESAVKEYLKLNKDNIKDGEVINGVLFFKDISVSA